MHSLHDFSVGVYDLLRVLSAIKEIFDNDTFVWLNKDLQELQTKLKGERFYLGILGEFKAGKSTLLNALAGGSFVPTGILPLTSIVTAVMYGPTPSARVISHDSSYREISIADVAEYVTEAKNPQNKKQVERVEIFLPAELLKDRLVILDTPGVGSFYEHNTEMTYTWLSHLDAAIFLLSSDRPVALSELHFLQEVFRYVPTVFLALNKIDRLDPESIQEIVHFNRNVIREKLGRDVEIRKLSCRMAIEASQTGNDRLMISSGLPDLLEELQTFLVRNKGKVFMASSIHKTSRILERLLTTLEAERDFLEMPVVELKERSEKLQRVRRQVDQRKSEVLVLLQNQQKELLSRLDRELESAREQITAELIREFRSFSKEMSYSGKTLYDWFRGALERRTFDCLERLEQSIREWLKTSLVPYAVSFEKIAWELASGIREVVDLVVDLKIPEPILEPRGIFRLRVKDPLEHIGLSVYSLFSYLSKSITRKRLARAYEESIRFQVEGATHAIRNDLSTRIRSSFHTFYSSFDEGASQAMGAISSGLQKALQYHSQQIAHRRDSLTQLQERISAVKQIMTQLQEFKNRYAA